MRRSWVKRGSAWLLVLASLLALAGCGAEEGAAETAGPDAAGDYVYVPEYLKLPDEITEITQMAVSGEQVYFIASMTSEEPGLYTMGRDGADITRLDCPLTEIPEDRTGSVDLVDLCVDTEGNIWILESTILMAYSPPEGWVETEDDPIENYAAVERLLAYARKLDAEGREILSIDLIALGGGSNANPSFFNDLATDAAGNLYILEGERELLVLNSGGALLFRLTSQRWISGLAQLSDGTVAAVYQDSSFRPVDAAAQSWGIETALPYGAVEIYSGVGAYLFYYTNGTNFFGYNGEAGEGEILFNWLNCDADYNAVHSVAAGDGVQVFYSTYDWVLGSSGHFELVSLTRRRADEVPEKVVLTLASLGLDYGLQSEILSFNRASGEYQIEVADYSQYNTDENPDGGLTVLTTEITAGKVPDLLDMSGLRARQYAGSGLLEDLYPYLDADAELSRAHILPNILAALEVDGQLLQTASSFTVETIVCLSDTVGETPEWTVGELLNLYAQQPEGTRIFHESTTRDIVLARCLALEEDSLVDWETGTCNFDSEPFIQLLTFAGLFLSEEEVTRLGLWGGDIWGQLADGTLLGMYNTIYTPRDIAQIQSYAGQPVTYKGFPTQTGAGSLLNIDGGVAMTTACADKEAAWAFIRTFFTAEYQSEYTYNFPTNRAAFDAVLETAMTPMYAVDPETGDNLLDENGELILQLEPVTQAEADQLLALIEDTDRLAEPDENILAIVREEAASYFAGQKTAEEAAALIQSRASLYVSEQR